MYQELYNFIAQNRELFRFLYSVVIAFICLIIVLKTDRIFRISSHQGIRYFRNAFFFYGIAFVLRYLFTKLIYLDLTRMLFEFFMIMGGFFLIYSLLWKKFESHEPSSLLNVRVVLFYFLTIVLVLFDYLWTTYFFMFLSQIILFAFASIISYKNYQKGNKKHKFLKLYFVVMILSFIAWSLNFVFIYFLEGRLRWLANVYALNVIVFLIFLYGVIKSTKRTNNP